MAWEFDDACAFARALAAAFSAAQSLGALAAPSLPYKTPGTPLKGTPSAKDASADVVGTAAGAGPGALTISFSPLLPAAAQGV